MPDLPEFPIEDGKRMTLETGIPIKWTENGLKREKDGHVHSATVDKFGNGSTNFVDGHMHGIRNGMIMDGGDDEESHFHKIYYTEYMGSKKKD